VKPPRVADWLLRTCVRFDRHADAIRGDLLEEYRRRAVASARHARWWYWREALSLIIRGQGYSKMLTFDALAQDVRFAWRSYSKARGFTLLVVITLALGIGASTAIFSIVNGILLRPLPFPDPDRLVWFSEANEQGRSISLSWPNFQDWQARQHSFEAMAASRSGSYTLTGLGQASRVTGRAITANFFTVIGVQPVLGRIFTPAEDTAAGLPSVIVSHAFWRTRLESDPAALGRTLTLGGRPYTIVGVLPRGFRYLRDYDVFLSMGGFLSEFGMSDRGNHQGFVGLARLKKGVTLDAALGELKNIQADLWRMHPDTTSGIHAVADHLKSRLVEEDRDTLIVLFGAVGILLLIACVNVANLLIAKGASRQHELAVRAALGGKRSRLAAQLLVESTLLSAAGGALGILLGSILLQALVAVAPEGTPRLDEVSLDGAALLFAIGAAMTCGILFGAFPAMQASAAGGQQLVIRTRAVGSTAGTHRLRRTLLVAEVALALVLLTGAGLMMRTLGRLTGVDPGFRPDHLFTLRLVLPAGYEDDAKRVAIARELVSRVRALPGVENVGVSLSLPIDGSVWNSSMSVRDRPMPHEQLPQTAMIPVDETFLQTLGVRLVQGRFFTADDNASSPPVAIVNESIARKFWPGESAIGKMIKQGWVERGGPWREVVGVVADVKFEGVTEATPLQFYQPFAQDPSGDFAVAIRTSVEPASVRSAVEGAITPLSRDMPMSLVRTMESMLASAIARQRMALIVLGVFALVALALAASGLYGLVAHSVTERTHEIGVRMALGAAGSDVVSLVIRHGLSMVALGVGIGLAGAAALSRTLRGLVFGIDPMDPPTFAAVALMLVAVSVVACYVPAWRATRIAPVTALRSE
jgi:putative ABC transport system permease protein